MECITLKYNLTLYSLVNQILVCSAGAIKQHAMKYGWIPQMKLNCAALEIAGTHSVYFRKSNHFHNFKHMIVTFLFDETTTEFLTSYYRAYAALSEMKVIITL